MPTHIVTVSFDETTNAFTYTGLTSTVAGPRLVIPTTTTEPATIRFVRAPEQSWGFRSISFLGSRDAEVVFFNAWRIVTAAEAEKGPVVVHESALLTLTVVSIGDAEIVIENTNPPKVLNLGYSFQLAIEDGLGQRWGTADPQVINEKETG